MSRGRAQRIVVYAASLALCAAVVHAYVQRRGPYLARPRTVVDHVEPGTHYLRDVIVAIDALSPAIPPGVTVTCFRPDRGHVRSDNDSFLTAVGLLPRRTVVPPFAADAPADALPDYVIAVASPLDHPGYELLVRAETGFLYVRRR